MAIGTLADFKINPDQFFGGMVETATQNVAAFNGASRNALILAPGAHTGQYQEEHFITYGGSTVSRRDLTSTAGVTPNGVSMDDFIRVKADRKIGPLSHTRDAFVKMGMNPDVFSSWIGEQVGPDVQADYLNNVIAALVACLTKQASTLEDQSGTGTLTTAMLAKALRKMGDRAGRVVAWVMHSTPAFDLFEDQIANYVGGIGSFLIIQGNTATLGKPVVVTDSSDLIETGTPDNYYTLALVAGAAGAWESESRFVDSTLKGHEEEQFRLVVKGEYAYTVGVKGFAYDEAAGGANPTKATLATSANWNLVANSIKDAAGVALKTQ